MADNLAQNNVVENKSTVRFILDGSKVEAKDATPTTTLLDYLREHAACSSVKEGCAEGDCGACTVALGELKGDTMHWQAVNSCIRFMPTIDAKEVITAKALVDKSGELHPVQQAMVDCHGSQCGFCTPGFVMSLFTHYVELDGEPAQREGLLNALSGNLCRCTGYRPIIDAGLSMQSYAEPKHLSVEDATCAGRVAQLTALKRSTGLKIEGFYAPVTAAEFAQAYMEQPQSLILAGGTDVGLWVTKQLRELPPILYLGDVAEFKHIDYKDGYIEVGAAVSLQEAFATLTKVYPEMKDFCERFASRPIRNSGTLCGNIANGSPIGDSMPALIALGSLVRLRMGDAVREMPLEDLYLAYQKKALAQGEFVEAVRVPMQKQYKHFATYKISKRRDQDISAVCAGLAMTLTDGVVTAVRIAFGGMAATPKRAIHTEQALLGKAFDEAALKLAEKSLLLDYQPLSDMRSSSAYRQATAVNLIRRFMLECQGIKAMRIEDTESLESLA
jgi:xanthine dehydrogenase small subunit